MHHYTAAADEVLQEGPLSNGPEVVAVTSNRDGAKMIAAWANLNTQALNRGFKGGLEQEIRENSKFMGNLIALMRKHGDSEMAQDVRLLLKKLHDRGLIFRCE